MSEMTQKDIDEAVKALREKWSEMVLDSEMSQTVFIATDKRATQFLADYQNMKEMLAKSNWELPDLVDGVSVNFK